MQSAHIMCTCALGRLSRLPGGKRGRLWFAGPGWTSRWALVDHQQAKMQQAGASLGALPDSRVHWRRILMPPREMLFGRAGHAVCHLPSVGAVHSETGWQLVFPAATQGPEPTDAGPAGLCGLRDALPRDLPRLRLEIAQGQLVSTQDCKLPANRHMGARMGCGGQGTALFVRFVGSHVDHVGHYFLIQSAPFCGSRVLGSRRPHEGDGPSKRG